MDICAKIWKTGTGHVITIPKFLIEMGIIDVTQPLILEIKNTRMIGSNPMPSGNPDITEFKRRVEVLKQSEAILGQDKQSIYSLYQYIFSMPQKASYSV